MKHNKNDYDAILLRAKQFIKLGNYENALIDANNYIAKVDDDTQGYLVKAQAFLGNVICHND